MTVQKLLENMMGLVLLCLIFISQIENILCAETAKTTECFVKKIPREEFTFKISTIDSSVPIKFTASLVGGSDLPSWMRITQGSLYDDPYLYGTPDEKVLQRPRKTTDKNKRILKIQVFAKNTETYEISKKKLTIRILPKRATAVYESEVVIRNLDISDILQEPVRADLLGRFRALWNDTQDVYYTHISSLLDEGGREPLPSTTGTPQIKNGVLVRMGSRHRFTDALRYVRVNTTTYVTEACRQDIDDKHPAMRLRTLADTVTIDAAFRPTYHIDWCRFTLITKRHSQLEESNDNLPNAAYVKAKYSGREEDQFVDNVAVLKKEAAVEFVKLEHVQERDVLPDIILCLLLPLVILILLLVALTCLFFCHRLGKAKRDSTTPPVEMRQYRTIHHVSDSLRSMSDTRDMRQPPQSLDTSIDPAPAAATTGAPLAESTPSRTESAPPPYSTPSPDQQDSSPTTCGVGNEKEEETST